MYSNGGGLGVSTREDAQENGWQTRNNKDAKRFKAGKAFVYCICPKCTMYHRVYMLWTGRGIPRKYCVNCKPLIAGYDNGAIYEAVISAPSSSKSRRHRLESE